MSPVKDEYYPRELSRQKKIKLRNKYGNDNKKLKSENKLSKNLKNCCFINRNKNKD